MSSPRLSVLIPVYNEAERLPAFLRSLSRLPASREILILDDGSTDGGTLRIKERPGLKVLRDETRRGKPSAVSRGLAQARGRLLLILDGDGEYPLEAAQTLLRAWKPGLGLVLGNRFHDGRPRNMTWLSALGNRILNGIFNLFFRTRLKDLETGCKLLDRRFAGAFLKALSGEKGPCDSPALVSSALEAGAGVLELSIPYKARPTAEKKIRARHGPALAWSILRVAARRSKPAPRPSGGPSLAAALGAALIASSFWLGYHHRQFLGLGWGGALKTAQLGRNLAQGEGYVTHKIRLQSLALSTSLPPPEFDQPPLPPLLSALSQKALGSNDEAAALPGLPLVFLAAGLAGLLAARLAGPGAALLCGLILGGHPHLLAYTATGGLVEAAAAALGALLLYGLEAGLSPWALGLSASLLYLTRSETLVLAPLLILLLAARGTLGGRRGLILFILSFLVPALPWLARNALLTGNPFFSLQTLNLLMYSRSFPSYSLHCSLIPSAGSRWVLAWMLGHGGEMLEKSAQGLLTLAWHGPASLGPGLGAGLLLALSGKGRARRTAAESLILMSPCALAWGLSNSYGSDIGRYALTFFPPLAAAASAELWVLLRSFRGGSLRSLGLALLLACQSWEGLRLRLYPQHPRSAAVLAEAAGNCPPGLVLVSFPESLAWRTRRLGAWLPRDFETLERLRSLLPVGGILLTPDLFFVEDPRRRDDLRFWGPFREAYRGGPPIPGFRKRADLGDGSQLWVPRTEGDNISP